MINREEAFSISIIDDEAPKDDCIICLLTVNDKICLLINKHGIYRLMLANHIDPGNLAPDTKHSYEKIFTVGASDEFVARTIIQANQILNAILLKPGINKALLLERIWDITQVLLRCRNIVENLTKEETTLLKKNYEIIEENQRRSFQAHIKPIKDLESEAEKFFSCSKSFCIKVFSLVDLVYGTKHKASNFEQAINKLKNLQAPQQIINALKKNLSWIRLLSECRNAVEHEEDGHKIYLKNFKLMPGNKFSPPRWRYDLSKKGLGSIKYSYLITDLRIFLDNMLHFFEELIMLIFINEHDGVYPLIFYSLSADKINKNCPVRHKVTLDVSKIKGMV